jgi:hypothetical protein
MRRFHRRYLTLLEMLIAMTMTVVILMVLASFYHNASYVGIELDRMKTENFSLRYLENRLMSILPLTLKQGRSEFLFFSLDNDGLNAQNSQSLIFTFNNGDSLDKIFSNVVIGRLYLDPDNALTLAYWPMPKRVDKAGVAIPMKKEVLMNDVESLHFEFYIPPEEQKKEQEEQETKPDSLKNEDAHREPEIKGEWSSALWLQEYHQLPALVRVTIKRSKDPHPLIFTIPLPSTKARIVYP